MRLLPILNALPTDSFALAPRRAGSGPSTLAGSLAGRLKGIGATAVSTVTGARTSGAGAGRGGGGGGGVAIGAEGVEGLVGESDVSLRGGVCAASLYESLTFALLSLAQAPARERAVEA